LRLGLDHIDTDIGGRHFDATGIATRPNTFPANDKTRPDRGQGGFSNVELRGFEPLTPTLPGPGTGRDQARKVHFGAAGGVVEVPIVVTVVVSTVVL
jgi:hypothetical protein